MPRKSDGSYVFSALEVAEICGNFANQTAINWIKRGHLKAFQTPGGQYRVYADDLADFLRSRGMRVPPELQKLIVSKHIYDSVLLVEQAPDLLRQMESFFAEEYPQHTVYSALDFFTAGKLAAEYSPRVYILDQDGMPSVERVCETIRAEDAGNNPIIIVCSSDDSMQDAIVSAGADALIRKERCLDEISETLNRLVTERSSS